MSLEGDVEIEKDSEIAETDTPKPESSEDLEETKQKSTDDCEDEVSADNKEESSTKEENVEDNLEGPPTLDEKAEAQESRWCDNYQFMDDEKPTPTEFNDKDPQKLILWAAEKDEIETLRKLLENDPSLVNARDYDLYTPLHRASYNNNVEVIRILLSYDADIRARTIDGWEPLHCACKWDSVEAVSLLIQNGADVNAETKGHITPLHLAASNVYGRRTLELLLWHPHIDPNVQNDGGDTPYDIARRSGPLGALFEILEESVNVY